MAPDVAVLVRELEKLLDAKDSTGRKVGNSQFGIYLFYDYDLEPIYVGQTREKLRSRVRRHLTNQRTDAVAMHVLDPFEVYEVELWPFYFPKEASEKEITATLNSAEYTIFHKALKASRLKAVLNEKEIPKHKAIKLPESFRAAIVPGSLLEARRHPDIRIARRARTISNLASVISERDVSKGLRTTLVTQARRLHWLADKRAKEIHRRKPIESPKEETGEELA